MNCPRCNNKMKFIKSVYVDGHGTYNSCSKCKLSIENDKIHNILILNNYRLDIYEFETYICGKFVSETDKINLQLPVTITEDKLKLYLTFS